MLEKKVSHIVGKIRVGIFKISKKKKKIGLVAKGINLDAEQELIIILEGKHMGVP